ncbi:MAG: hypothetical protein WC915_00350 [archaeon]|jgi:hypothetical protein
MKPFDLLVWAIVSIILIIIMVTIFNSFFPQPDVITEINKKISLAETNFNLGTTVFVGNLQVPKDFFISQNSFGLTNRSVAIECTDQLACCNKNDKCEKIEWDNTYALFNQSKTLNIYVRCYENVISICKIYLGKDPAQATITKIDLTKTEENNFLFSIKTKNTGNTILAQGKLYGTIFKKVQSKWESTNIVSEIKTIETLLQDQEFSFVEEFNLTTPGEYRVEFNFSAENGGFDTNYFDFNIEKNTNCKTIQGEETFIGTDPTKINTQKFCEGCNFGYECYEAWKTIMPQKEWIITDKTSVYYETSRPIEELYNPQQCANYAIDNILNCNYGPDYCPDVEYPITPENSFDTCCCSNN